MLKQLQIDFYEDILNPKDSKNYLDNAKFTASDLMNIYHNNYFSNFTNALEKTYSCVLRLVGKDFFNMLAKEFVKKHPSKTGNMIDYGHEFVGFIENNQQCKVLPYLSDVAKFELFYERCYFSLNSKFFMHSNYPLIKIWQLDENSKQLDFSQGEDYLKINKQGAEVVVEKITKQEYENEQNN